MTKWKFRIDTPWGKKGEDAQTLIHHSGGKKYIIDFSDYPQIFEPIEEKSDEEYLGFYLFERSGPLSGDESMKLAERLLSSNAINPDFLETLRKGEK